MDTVLGKAVKTICGLGGIAFGLQALASSPPPTAPTNLSYNASTNTIQFTTGANTTFYEINKRINKRTGSTFSLIYMDEAAGSNTQYSYDLSNSHYRAPGLYQIQDVDISNPSYTASSYLVIGSLAAPTNVQYSTATFPAQIDLSWNPVTVAGDPDPATYTIYKNGTVLGTSTTPDFIDQKVNPNTNYTYTVSASLDGGVSAQTVPVNVPGFNYPAPTPPTNVTLTGYTDTDAAFTWTNGSNIAYTVISSTTGTPIGPCTINGCNVIFGFGQKNQNIIGSLEPNTMYDLALEVCNGLLCATYQPSSGNNPLWFKTYPQGSAEPPTNFKAQFNLDTTTTPATPILSMTWVKSKYDPACEAGNYEIVAANQITGQTEDFAPTTIGNTAANGCYAAALTSSNPSAFIPSDLYIYTVRVVSSGYPALNDVDLIGPAPAPAPPTNFVVTSPYPGDYQVSWSAGQNAQAYNLQRSINGAAWITLSSSYVGTTYEDKNLPINEVVTYRIQSLDGAQTSNFVTAAAQLGGNPDRAPATMMLFVNNNPDSVSASGSIIANGKSPALLEPILYDSNGKEIPFTSAAYNHIYYLLAISNNLGGTNEILLQSVPFIHLYTPSQYSASIGAYCAYPWTVNGCPYVSNDGNPATRYLVSSAAGEYTIMAVYWDGIPTDQPIKSGIPGPNISAYSPPAISESLNTNQISSNGSALGYLGFSYNNGADGGGVPTIQFQAGLPGIVNLSSLTSTPIYDDLKTATVSFTAVNQSSNVITPTLSATNDFVASTGTGPFSLKINELTAYNMPQYGMMTASFTDVYGDSWTFQEPYLNQQPQARPIYISGNDQLYAFVEPSFFEHARQAVELLVDFYSPTKSVSSVEYTDDVKDCNPTNAGSNIVNCTGSFHSIDSTVPDEPSDFNNDDYAIRVNFTDGTSRDILIGGNGSFGNLMGIPSDVNTWVGFTTDGLQQSPTAIGNFCDDYAIESILNNTNYAYNCTAPSNQTQ